MRNLVSIKPVITWGISRATFDNYVREGKIPKGLKQPGFKELFWLKRDLDEIKEKLQKK